MLPIAPGQTVPPAAPEATSPPLADGAARRRGVVKTLGTDLILGIGTVAALVLLWQAAEATGVLNPSVIPGPVAVWRALVTGFASGGAASPLAADSFQTLLRLLSGFLAGAVIGLAVSIAAACSQAVRDFLDPLVAIANVIPAVITLPVIALWAGVGTETIILVTAYSTAIPVYRGALAEVKGADRTLAWAARSLGARGWRYLCSVMLPLTMIGAVRNIRVALGYAWRASIAAEILVVAQQGLGSLTFDAHQYGNMATMVAALVTILVIGLVLDLAALLIQARVLRHRGLIAE